MAFSQNVWNQLKNLTKGELISALERDNWTLEDATHSSGSVRLYVKLGSDGKPIRRVEIHFHHAKDTCGRKLLTGLLEAAGWSESDMRKLKLVK